MTGLLPLKQQSIKNKQHNKRLFGLVFGVILLIISLFASLMIGAKPISLTSIWDMIFYNKTNTIDYVIIQDSRMVRSILAILAGMAFGVAGALMQAITRNPLADCGVLGVNAGASLSVVLMIGVFGLNSIHTHIWFALLGAIIVTFIVYILGNMGRNGVNTVRLILAGVAVSAVLHGLSSGITLLNPYKFASTRIWTVGSVAGRNMDIILAVLPFLLVGLLIALITARSLNAVALGDELAHSFGANIIRLRFMSIIAVTLLAGAATASVGPISFIGLMVPHIVRWFTGPDQRWIMFLTMIYGAILLLLADSLGRLLLYPAELEAGVVTAFIGAPMLIFLVRFKKVSGL